MNAKGALRRKEVQSNPVNEDSKGAIESVSINGVSVKLRKV